MLSLVPVGKGDVRSCFFKIWIMIMIHEVDGNPRKNDDVSHVVVDALTDVRENKREKYAEMSKKIFEPPKKDTCFIYLYLYSYLYLCIFRDE